MEDGNMNMRKLFLLSVLLLFLSCKEPVYTESSFIFQLPQKEIFVKTTKYPGARFAVFFAQDSLSLTNSKDSIEFKTGSYIQIMVNITDVFVRSSHSKILSIGTNHFNIEVVSDSVFNLFCENNIQKYPYSFIHIDTREYRVAVNQQLIKKGDIYGGW